MNRSLRHYALTGLTLGVSAINCFAAESTVYSFKDGTVTVTPRPSQATPASKNDSKQVNAKTAVSGTTSPQISEKPQRVRPVSHLQISPESKLDELQLTVNELEPKLEEVIQPVAQAPLPGPVNPPLQPAPTLQPTPMPPEVSSQPGCCDDQLPVIVPRPSDALPKPTTTLSMAAMYREVYAAIPFSRVEFNHYPNYRHDATMEFLFNQMRTTIINRSTGSAGNDYSYGPAYGGYMGYPYYDPPAYPFSYGLRIHTSR